MIHRIPVRVSAGELLSRILAANVMYTSARPRKRRAEAQQSS